MIGGFRGTAGRLALAALLGAVGTAVFVQKPARAADLDGDCCADLEERVAELEATTVRKGNKKVSITLYGRVSRIVNFWDDGAVSNASFGGLFAKCSDLTISADSLSSGPINLIASPLVCHPAKRWLS